MSSVEHGKIEILVLLFICHGHSSAVIIIESNWNFGPIFGKYLHTHTDATQVPNQRELQQMLSKSLIKESYNRR